MLGYLCAYYRHYYPLEFITSFLNNAANDDDIQSGTSYAEKVGIKVTSPKWGSSLDHYYFDKQENTIAKGLASIKYIGGDTGKKLYDLSKQKDYEYFSEVVIDALDNEVLDTRQLDVLIKIDFFSNFGNQRELLTISDLVIGKFKRGKCKQIKKESLDATNPKIQEIVQKHSSDETKSGKPSSSYRILDMKGILTELESYVREIGLEDIPLKTKIQNFYDATGHVGYVSGREEDRRKLYVTNVFLINSKKDGLCIGERIMTKSIGSGKESSITVWNSLYRKNRPVGYELCDGTQTKYIISDKIDKGDLIELVDFSVTHSERGTSFILEGFKKIY